MNPEDFLRSRGWVRTRVTRVNQWRYPAGVRHITWWANYAIGTGEYPQFFALDLERLGWANIIGQAPPPSGSNTAPAGRLA